MFSQHKQTVTDEKKPVAAGAISVFDGKFKIISPGSMGLKLPTGENDEDVIAESLGLERRKEYWE